MKKKLRKRAPREPRPPPQEGAGVDYATSMWNTTRAVELTTGRTISEYLSEQGLQSPVSDTGRIPSPDALLHVEGGRKYEVRREVATGGMGRIQEVRDLNCRRTVAMKVLNQENPKFRAEDLLRFIEEAQITAQLEHPNIVPVHELGLDAAGGVFYTMKYVKGLTLTDILDSIRRGHQDIIEQYPLGRLLTIYQKACDAVAFAHSRGVVHRDLKPDNIMVGDYGEVLVMDWGLAKALGRAAAPPGEDLAGGDDEVMLPAAADETEDARPVRRKTDEEPVTSVRTDKPGTGLRTISGRIMGTPGFMAPEQTRTDGTPVDARADIYSLGAILYSTLTLRPPVGDKDLKAAIRRVRAGDIIPPFMYNRWLTKEGEGEEGFNPENYEKKIRFPHCPDGAIPAVLSEIAMKAMETDPADRFATVPDLQHEIEAYQDGLIWNLLVDEAFTDAGEFESRWEVHGGQWELRDGELRVYGGEPQYLLLKKPLSGDVRIEFECRQESVYLNDVACFMSAVPSQNWKEIPSSGYEFKYGGYSNSANVLARSDKQLWSEAASPLLRGQTYRVRAERVGRRLGLTVNGVEVFKVVDKDPLSGGDRTAVGVLGWMADTRYSRIRVYSMGAPWKTDVLDVAERHLLKGNYQTAMDLFQEVVDSLPETERLERARRGHNTAQNRHRLGGNLSSWRERLENAWPGKGVNIRMDNDGLTVDISNAGVISLEPLRGMPLTALYCAHNDISDLEPLRGMPLVTLNCGGNPIRHLEPLADMPLSKLLCEGCPVESLAPLKGMPLTMLNCGGARLADGLKPLRGMTLSWLSCWNSEIEGLEPLRGMPLTALYCDGNRIETLEPLRGMALGSLLCSGNRVDSLEPVRGMPLTTLHCGGNRISDLEPLRGMPLNMFSCHTNIVESLRPLADLPIGSLTCGDNRLAGLEPFLRNPPYSFLYDCDTLPDTELALARDLWSRDPRFEHHVRQLDVLLALREGDVDRLRGLAGEFRGHRYLFIPRFMEWDSAGAFCKKLGGHLVTITSKEENAFITSLMPGGSWFWLGLLNMDRGRRWVTGEPFGFGTFNDLLRERMLGPKIFCSGTWSCEVYAGVRNCFMIEWDQ